MGFSWSGSQVSTATAAAFYSGLRDAGWREGENLVIDVRLYDDHPEQMPYMAAELLGLQPDVLVGGIVPTQAFVQATHSIPIVMGAVDDPVGLGLIASYARPAGNVTGTSRTAGRTSMGKQLEFLRLLVPGFARVAVAYNPQIRASVTDLGEIQASAETLGIDAQPVAITSADEVERALQAALAGNPQALLMTAMAPQNGPAIAAFATQHGLPSAGENASSGVLLTYAPDLPALWYRTGNYYVDRILRGAKPADLPVEAPTAFNLVVNRTTAQTLRLTIPTEFAGQVSQWVD